MNILVYRLSALGDVAMTIPAIYSCAYHWPQHTFHIVTTEFCAQLFLNAPENIVMHPVTKPVSTWQILLKLNRLDIDIVADLHNVLRSWIVDMLFMTKGKRICMVDKSRSSRGAILKERKTLSRPFTQRYFDVFYRLGLPCQPLFSSLFSTPPQIPVKLKKRQEQWIGIAPFARYSNKTYPIEMMREVTIRLAMESHTRVFLFGGRGIQADTLIKWEHLSPTIHNVAGRFTIAEELALMSILDVMISMDSANQHLASLVGTRVISIWGSTTPACGFTGYRQNANDAILLGLSCQPCTISGSKRCKKDSLECLNMLLPQTLVDIIKTKTYQDDTQ